VRKWRSCQRIYGQRDASADAGESQHGLQGNRTVSRNHGAVHALCARDDNGHVRRGSRGIAVDSELPNLGPPQRLNIDPAAAVGLRNVTLTTGSEGGGSWQRVLGPQPPPALTQVNPNSGLPGATESAGCDHGAVHPFCARTTQASFGAGITVVSLTVNSPQTASAVLTSTWLRTGPRTVTLTTGPRLLV